MISGVDWIRFSSFGDERGSLVPIENDKDIPFRIGRIYYIYDTAPDAVRGKHAHKDLNQVLLCLSGSCDVLLDNGKEREIVTLNTREEGIYIHGFIWREMLHFSADCDLLALVDRPYDPEDYVFDYSVVKRFAEEGGLQ